MTTILGYFFITAIYIGIPFGIIGFFIDAGKHSLTFSIVLSYEWLIDFLLGWLLSFSGFILELLGFIITVVVAIPLAAIIFCLLVGIFLLPINIIISYLSTISNQKKYRKLDSALKEQINIYSKEIDLLLDKLEQPLSLIPPDYRTSHCLSIFYNSYINRKVDNLKEAVIECDRKLENEKQEKQLNSILSSIKDNTSMLEEMYSKMDDLNNTLKHIDRNIKSIF